MSLSLCLRMLSPVEKLIISQRRLEVSAVSVLHLLNLLRVVDRRCTGCWSFSRHVLCSGHARFGLDGGRQEALRGLLLCRACSRRGGRSRPRPDYTDVLELPCELNMRWMSSRRYELYYGEIFGSGLSNLVVVCQPDPDRLTVQQYCTSSATEMAAISAGIRMFVACEWTIMSPPIR